MRWLVTGGAGFLGINFVRHVLARSDAVVSLDREPFDYPELPRITEVRGDIRDRAAVSRAAAGCDVVVHAAAALPLYSPAEIHAIDVDGTRTVLAAARDAGCARVVHISSTAVYGVPDHHPLVETDRLHGVGPYGIAKVAAETECVAARERGQIVAIVRPKSFVGPERLGVFALLYEWAREGRDFPILGRGDNRYQLLDVEDLCDAIRLAGATDVNETFNIGAAEFTTLRQDFQAVLDAAGRGGEIRSLPVAPALWALRVLERAKLSPLYPWIYETVTEDSFVSIDRARDRLGWQPRYSNRDALIRNFQWYLANADRLGEAGVTHRAPWKQGALAMAKWVFRPHATRSR